MSAAVSPLLAWRSAVVDSTLDATTKLVALVLSTHMSKDGDSCFPRVSTIAREASLAERTVSERLAVLDTGGWIERVYDRRARGRGTEVHYFARCPQAATTRPESAGGQSATTRAPEAGGRQRPPALSRHDHPRFHDTTTRAFTTRPPALKARVQ